MMGVTNRSKILPWQVSSILLTVGDCKILAIRVHEVLAYLTVNRWAVLQAFPTYIAEFPFVVRLFRPTMCNRVLDQACRDAGAGRDDGLETAVVHHEVAHFADVPLL